MAEKQPDVVQLIDSQELALGLGVSPRTVRRLVLERRIPFTRVGARLVRFDPNDIRAYIASNRVEAR